MFWKHQVWNLEKNKQIVFDSVPNAVWSELWPRWRWIERFDLKRVKGLVFWCEAVRCLSETAKRSLKLTFSLLGYLLKFIFLQNLHFLFVPLKRNNIARRVSFSSHRAAPWECYWCSRGDDENWNEPISALRSISTDQSQSRLGQLLLQFELLRTRCNQTTLFW